jgi:hypothetical protein
MNEDEEKEEGREERRGEGTYGARDCNNRLFNCNVSWIELLYNIYVYIIYKL